MGKGDACVCVGGGGRVPDAFRSVRGVERRACRALNPGCDRPLRARRCAALAAASAARCGAARTAR